MNITTTATREAAALEVNENGEIKGYGAPWVCASHGDEGHNYLTCPACHGEFDRRFPPRFAARGTA